MDLFPDAQRLQLCRGLPGPIAIGRRRRGAGMQYPADLERASLRNHAGLARGKCANADDPFGPQNIEYSAQVGVAHRDKRALSPKLNLSGVRLRPPASKKASGQ